MLNRFEIEIRFLGFLFINSLFFWTIFYVILGEWDIGIYGIFVVDGNCFKKFLLVALWKKLIKCQLFLFHVA